MARRAKAGPSEQTLFSQSRGFFFFRVFRISILPILFTSCWPSTAAAPPAARARAPQERNDMTWVQDVTAWVLGCGRRRRQQRSQEAEGGSHTRTVKPNSGSTATLARVFQNLTKSHPSTNPATSMSMHENSSHPLPYTRRPKPSGHMSQHHAAGGMTKGAESCSTATHFRFHFHSCSLAPRVGRCGRHTSHSLSENAAVLCAQLMEYTCECCSACRRRRRRRCRAWRLTLTAARRLPCSCCPQACRSNQLIMLSRASLAQAQSQQREVPWKRPSVHIEPSSGLGVYRRRYG